VSTSSCDRTDSWFFYTAIYLLSVGYVLPNCFFEEKELKKVQQSALRAFLAKSGYNRNTNRFIVFAPIRFGGCGFLHLYLIQGEGQIIQFLTHWRTKTTVGDLLRVAVAWVQLHLGTSWFFLADPTTPLPHFPGRWLKSLRQFLARIHGSLEVDSYFLPPIQRTNDVYIMDLVLSSNCFSEYEIRVINYCRMYLQSVTMSDICLADGVTIDPAFLLGTPTATSSTSKWVNINQARPDESSWRLWRTACSQWSLNGKLHFPVGQWTQAGDQLRRTWPFYYDHSNGELYVRQTSNYLRCLATDAIRFTFSSLSKLCV
jgi:hypothetical protein